MLLLLILAFTVIPAIEIGLFVVVGGEIGPLATVAVVLFTGIAGASLARTQGLKVLQQIQDTLGKGTMPANELVEGALILFGGALLLTPGFLTDAWGLACLLPPTRRLMAVVVKRWLARRMKRTGPNQAEVGGWRVWSGGVHPGPATRENKIDLGQKEPAPRGGPQTIDATFSVVDEAEGDAEMSDPPGTDDSSADQFGA